MKGVKHHLPLAGLTALLILLIAALAGGNLWLLRRMYQKSLHASTADTVLGLGRMIVGELAEHPAVTKPATTDQDWADFSRLAYSVHRVESGLEYVSVTQGGIILYHEQMEPSGQPSVPLGLTNAGAIRIGRLPLMVANETVPVITFTMPVKGNGNVVRSIQIAIRKDAVPQKEAAAAAALTTMFRVSLLTIGGSFGLSVALVMWLFSRELRRQQTRREEEHLAFAGALADGIIHDFRNPLSAMRLDVQMLHKEASKGGEGRPDRLMELAERIRRTIDRADMVFREFLFVSKPESGQPEAIDLNVALRDCLDLLSPRVERLGLKVAAEIAAHPLPARGYPVSLKRAFLNILINAEQASPEGGTIFVKSWREGGDGMVEIADQGPGIPPSDRRRVFEMFVSTRPGGTGLGLNLAKRAIEDCGGSISALDRAGGGARMVIRIPMVE